MLRITKSEQETQQLERTGTTGSISNGNSKSKLYSAMQEMKRNFTFVFLTLKSEWDETNFCFFIYVKNEAKQNQRTLELYWN